MLDEKINSFCICVCVCNPNAMPSHFCVASDCRNVSLTKFKINCTTTFIKSSPTELYSGMWESHERIRIYHLHRTQFITLIDLLEHFKHAVKVYTVDIHTLWPHRPIDIWKSLLIRILSFSARKSITVRATRVLAQNKSVSFIGSKFWMPDFRVRNAITFPCFRLFAFSSLFLVSN